MKAGPDRAPRWLQLAAAAACGVVLGMAARPLVRTWKPGGGGTDPAAAGGAGLANHATGAGDGRAGPAGRPAPGATGTAPPEPSAGAAALAAGAERWLTLAERAATARAAEIPAMLWEAGDDRALREMLAARWMALDPGHMFDQLVAERVTGSDRSDPGGGLLTQLVRHWAAASPERVAEALSLGDGAGSLWGIRATAVNEIMKRDPGLGLRMLREWNIRNYLPDMKKVGEWARSDPLAAAEAVAALGQDFAGREATEELGKAWGATDPRAALRYAAEAGSRLGPELARHAMTTWAGDDLDAAVEFASSSSDGPDYLNAIGVALVSEWAKSDPAAAVAWSESTLNAPGRAGAIQAVISSLGASDLGAAAEVVAGLPPGGARKAALSGLLETWTGQGKVDADRLGAWLCEISSTEPGAPQRALQSSHWKWQRSDPESALAFVSGEYAALAPDSMVRWAASEKVRADPLSAIEWAAGVGGAGGGSSRDPDAGARAGRIVVETWFRTQPDAAMRWAATLDDPGDRAEAVGAISGQVAFSTPERIRAWVGQLGPGDRAAAVESLRAMRLSPRWQANVDAALGLAGE